MQKAKYVRMFADKDGESHFEDLEVELNLMNYAPPAAPLNFLQFLPAAQTFWLGGASDWSGDTFHPSPRRQLICVLQGEVEQFTSDGASRRFAPGDVLLSEDTWGKGHSARFLSDEVLVLGIALANPQ